MAYAQRRSESPIKYKGYRYTLPIPRPPPPGKSRLSVCDFQAVVARLRQHRVNSLHIRPTEDLIDGALVLCRNSSICSLAQYVFQTLAEYELSLKIIRKDMSQHDVIKAMAEERGIKVVTLKNSYVSPSKNIVESILRFFSLSSPLPSFSEPEDRVDSTPWTVVIVLIVFLGKY